MEEFIDVQKEMIESHDQQILKFSTDIKQMTDYMETHLNNIVNIK